MEFFERPCGGERAVLVHVSLGDGRHDEDLAEFRELALSAGVDVVGVITGSRARPDARLYIGSGKLEEIKSKVAAESAEVVLFDNPLTPAQERNLERELECRVLDRTGLILDIFAQRARTHEGKLQVELAQLEHLASRLVRGWSHLERQKGGIGLRGPGETQLETDRRLLKLRVSMLKERLERVRRTRQQGRSARQKAALPTVSLVGYTNAGKSTLFNRLCGAEVYAADQLFATLDPTLRRLSLPNAGAVVLADTVGFIRHLPHRLVEAFRATLEETVEADLLLHVVDAASQERDRNMVAVEEVLTEVGAAEVPRLEVFNKLDLLGEREPRVEYNADGRPVRVWVSALSGAGLSLVREAVARCLGQSLITMTLSLVPEKARLRARLFAAGAIQSERLLDSGGWELSVCLARDELEPLLREEGMQAVLPPLPESP